MPKKSFPSRNGPTAHDVKRLGTDPADLPHGHGRPRFSAHADHLNRKAAHHRGGSTTHTQTTLPLSGSPPWGAPRLQDFYPPWQPVRAD